MSAWPVSPLRGRNIRGVRSLIPERARYSRPSIFFTPARECAGTCTDFYPEDSC